MWYSRQKSAGQLQGSAGMKLASSLNATLTKGWLHSHQEKAYNL